MENQHKLVTGYRDFSEQELDTINSIKLAEQDIGQLWQQVAKVEGVDQRCMATAKTQLQQAFSWFVRAVARPIDPFTLVLEDPKPETYLTRLEAESKRTAHDLTKLNSFIGSEEFNGLGEEVQSDLREQSRILTELAFILSKRYDDLTR